MLAARDVGRQAGRGAYILFGGVTTTLSIHGRRWPSALSLGDVTLQELTP